MNNKFSHFFFLVGLLNSLLLCDRLHSIASVKWKGGKKCKISQFLCTKSSKKKQGRKRDTLKWIIKYRRIQKEWEKFNTEKRVMKIIGKQKKSKKESEIERLGELHGATVTVMLKNLLKSTCVHDFCLAEKGESNELCKVNVKFHIFLGVIEVFNRNGKWISVVEIEDEMNVKLDSFKWLLINIYVCSIDREIYKARSNWFLMTV